MLVSRLENANKAMCCAFVGSGVVVGGEDGRLVDCRLSRDHRLAFGDVVRVNHQAPVTCVVGSAQGDGVLSSDKAGHIHFQRPSSSTFSFLLEPRIVNSVCFFNGEEGVLSAQQRGVVATWRLETNATVTLPTGHKPSESVSDVVCLLPQLIASTSTDRSARVFDLNSNANTHEFALGNHGRSLVRGESEFDLVVGCRGGIVRVFDLRAGAEPKLQVQAHAFGVGAMSCRGGVLATCSSDRTCKVWKWANGELILQHHLREFGEGVSDVHLSEDHAHLLVSAYDNTVRLYDLAHNDRLLARTVIEQGKLVGDLERLITSFLW